jgi:uncharacterized membrane protein YccC
MPRAPILQRALTFDRAAFAPGRALHMALGVGAPLAVGVATDRVLEGVAVAGGALVVGFADLGGPYLGRARTLLAASVAVALSTLVGLLTGGNDWLTVLLMGVWGLGAGLTVALGQSASFVGLMSALALLLAADFPADGPEAMRRSALVLAGGLLETLLAVVVWPIRPTGPERAAVAAAGRDLADIADDWPALDGSGFIRSVTTAEAMLAEHRTWTAGGVVETLHALSDDFEGIYGVLTTLRSGRERLDTGEAAELDEEVAVAARNLRAVAAAVESGRPPAAVFARDTEPVVPGVAVLRDRLRTAASLTEALNARGRSRTTVSERRHAGRSRTPALEVLRANLTLESTACRHALRLGTTLAVAVAVYRVFPLGRGYWVPLTVVFVLRPDYGATFTRGLQRYAGTVVGVGLSSAVAAALTPGYWADTILVTAFAWAACATFFANYALFTASITALIVFFVGFADVDTYRAIVDRVEDTAIGGALALAAFALWPTWEGGERVAARVADLLDADRVFVRVALTEASGSATAGRDEVDRARSAARLARSNAEASLQRALAEPTRFRGDMSAAGAVMLASRPLADAILAVDARTVGERQQEARPDVPALAAQLDEALAELADAVRHDRPAPRLQSLPRRAAPDDSTPAWLRHQVDAMLESVHAIGGALGGHADIAPGR